MPAEELDELVRVLEMYSHDAGRQRIVAALGEILELHRRAFERVLAIARDEGASRFLESVRKDELLSGILVGYGLLSISPEERAQAVLRDFAARLAETKIEARVLEVREEKVRVQLLGRLGGGGAELDVLRSEIEESFREQFPEGGIEVSAGTNLAYAELPRKWLPLLHRHEIEPGGLRRVQLFEEGIVVGEAHGRVFAFREKCPAGEESLEDSALEDGRMTCPAHGLRFDLRTGRCLEQPELSLVPVPVSVEDGAVKVAL